MEDEVVQNKAVQKKMTVALVSIVYNLSCDFKATFVMLAESWNGTPIQKLYQTFLPNPLLIGVACGVTQSEQRSTSGTSTFAVMTV